MGTVPNTLNDTSVRTLGDEWGHIYQHTDSIAGWLLIFGYGLVRILGYIGGGILAVYLADLLPGLAGALGFFTIGLTVVFAVPRLAQKLVFRVLTSWFSSLHH